MKALRFKLRLCVLLEDGDKVSLQNVVNLELYILKACNGKCPNKMEHLKRN
jgi:hypothetical protein